MGEASTSSGSARKSLGLRGKLKSLPYKWIALSVTTLGVLMAAIDTTIVILAIPEIMSKLHSDLISMIWVIMGYILVTTVFLLTFGRVADMLGRVRMYNVGFLVFTFGSLLCGFAASGTQLIVFRLVQGVGGAMLAVNSMAIVTEAFPAGELGRAMGLNGITFAVGSIVGPILGGLILTLGNWRWVFFINVPVGILGTLWGYLQLHELSRRKQRESFDYVGALSFSLALVLVLFALTESIDFGWTSPIILGMFAGFLGLVALFVWWEKRHPHPVLDFGVFSNRVFNFSVLAAMLQSLALYAVNFIVVFYLQAVRGFDPLRAAVLLIPLPVASSAIGPFSGIVSDRIGARIPASLGLLIQIVGLFWLSHLGPAAPYLQIAIGLGLVGLGGGMFWSPNTSAAMGSAPRDRLGVAAATLATLRNSGMVTSFALILAVIANAMPHNQMMQVFVGLEVNLPAAAKQAFVSGMHSAFWVSIAVCFIAVLFSLVRGREDRRALTQASVEVG
ncbi:MAG: MFS transporter [Anaerolineales bacterium]